MTLILGLDPGSRRTGFGLVHITGNTLEYVSSGTIHINEKAEWPERLNEVFDSVREIIAKHPGEKIVYFSIHLNALQILSAEFGDIPHVIIDGSIPLKTRNKYVAEMRDPNGAPQIAFVTMRTCATGLDMTPGVSVVVIGELDDNQGRALQQHQDFRHGASPGARRPDRSGEAEKSRRHHDGNRDPNRRLGGRVDEPLQRQDTRFQHHDLT